VGAGPAGVDVVVTDAEGGDDFEPGKSLHKGTIDPLLGGRDRHAAHARRALGEEFVPILGVGEFDEVEGAGEPVHDDGLGRTDQENIGFFSHLYPLGISTPNFHTSIVTGCATNFWNAASNSAPSAPSTTR